MSISPAPSTARNGDTAESSSIYGQLIEEWSRLCTQPSTSRQLRRWAISEPALADAGSLQELLMQIDEGSRQVDDAMLGALVRLFHAGQTMAGRVVLQAMLPKLIRFARTTRPTRDGGAGADHRQVIVATFWSVLASYPIDRRATSVASGLALDTLNKLTAELRGNTFEEVPVDPQHLTVAVQEQVEDIPGPAGSISADADLLEVIAWGLDTEVLTKADAAMLVQVYLPQPGQNGTAAAAEQLGLSPATVRQRCSRARRRLVTAVHAERHGLPLAAEVGAAAATAPGDQAGELAALSR
ncbi:hypothetical protein [Klenkia sp. PcliD-1-E]|uniref:hypothetical protein n=1 Tax=Klenkia sp. PcliD-1-E TaxID=2954492 RepID=UPI00209736F2|nr:hypothetical protein [Klenkia sp. PcliD-1-E]MCO7219528.1 hypothetical protein [Klenkia sp. PcliD-1-E]